MRPFSILRCFSGIGLLGALLFSKEVAADDASSYGHSDCLMENCSPTQSGYLEGHNFDPAIVGGPTWGQLWNTLVEQGGQFLAQPITYTPPGQSQSVIVASETNKVYILDATIGSVRKQRTLGLPVSSVDVQCPDVAPWLGVTGTPVLDPASQTLYFWSKQYAEGTTSGLGNARYKFYGVDPVTLEDKFKPFDMEGIYASNRPSQYFEGGKVLQRTGLLLSNGIVYAGFGGHCDNFNYTGWIVGMDAKSGEYVTSFSTQSGPFGTIGSGVWQAGGGLASDGTNMWFVTGNGWGQELAALPRIGRNVPGALPMAVVKMPLTRNLSATDFFIPADYKAIDAADQDFGSSGVALLPTGFGAGGIGRLAIANGKNSKAYIMNADNLGGYKTGIGGGDGNLQTIPLGGQSFSTAGGYPLEGGFLYISATGSPTLALRFGTDANGFPTFAQAGQTVESASDVRGAGHTTTTSMNGQQGSGLVWITDVGNGNLRVYNALPPADGKMKAIYTATFTGGAKYQRPVPGNGRMFIATMSGTIVALGAPVNLPLNCSTPLQFGTVVVGRNATLPVTCTALIDTQITVTRLSDAASFSMTTIPTTPLKAKSSFNFNITWAPTKAATVAGTLLLNTTIDAANKYVHSVPIVLRGIAATAGPTFSLVPNNVAFGGLVPGAADSIGGVNKTVSLSNLGLSGLTVTGWDFDEIYGGDDDDDDDDDDAPTAASAGLLTGDADGKLNDRKTTTGNFTLYSMPTTISNQSSTALTLNFNPTVDGTFKAVLKIFTNGGNSTVLLTGSAAGPAQLVFSTQQYDGSYLNLVSHMDFGNVLDGTSRTLRLNVTNTGASALTITKSKPPTGPLIYALNPAQDLTESDQIQNGDTESAAIQLTSPGSQVNVAPYNTTGTWVLNGNDPNFGVHFVEITARIVSRQVGPLLSHASDGDVNGTARYQYLGCFAEDPTTKLFATRLTTSQQFENGECQTLGLQKGLNFVGSEYANECYGSFTPPPQSAKVSDDSCQMACLGDSSQICGGANLISVFYDTLAYNASSSSFLPGAFLGPKIVSSVNSYQYVDCVSDNGNPRPLTGGGYTDGTKMTVEGCVSYCSARGQSIAGLEFGSECYCGNTLGTNSARNQTGCTMLCAGSNQEYCGGPSRMLVYAVNGNLTGGAPPSTTTTTSATTSTSTSAPSGLSAADIAAYKGCWSDSVAKRVLTANPVSGSSVFIGSCRATCAAQGYVLAGVEYGRECWCGNALAQSSTQKPETDCSMTCAGNSTQLCGAGDRLSVYTAANAADGSATTATATSTATNTAVATTTTATTATATAGPGASTSPSYVGCYTDSVASRTFPFLGARDATVSIDVCRSICAIHHYTLAGVEYANECFCGNSIPSTSTLAAESDCNMKCTGNATQTCGAGDRLSVYQVADTTTGSTATTATSTASSAATSSTATATTTTSSGAPTSSATAAYKGCYSDADVRTLSYRVLQDATVTNEVCRAACSAKGYQIAGTEYANECWCGNGLFGGATLKPEGDCNMPCAGDQKQMCGGPNRLSLYSDVADLTKLVVSQPDTIYSAGVWNSLGCYTDDASRALRDKAPQLGSSNTIEACAAACQGYTYFGVEYSTECYCGNNLMNSPKPAPKAECNFLCGGNSLEYCGAGFRMGLYRFNATAVAPINATSGGSSVTQSSPTAASGGTNTATNTETNNNTATNTSTNTAASSTSTSTATSTTSSTAAASTVDGVSAQGCFIDDSGARSLSVTAYQGNNTNSVAGCALTCRARGFRYSGVEYGSECYCDNFVLNKAASGGAGAMGCSYVCPGDKTSMCGGSGRINISKDSQWQQKLFTVKQVSQWQFSDCYVDSTGARVLNVALTPQKRTVESCLEACAASNLATCGVEYGGECFGRAGELGAGATVAPSAGADDPMARGCNMPCGDNSTIACGGANRISVYRLDKTVTSQVPSVLFQIQ
ncbi:hypothetical protein ACQY0O_003556 [Thecaphora frezii]